MSNVIQFPTRFRRLDPEGVDKFNKEEAHRREQKKKALKGVIDALEPLGLFMDQTDVLRSASKFYGFNMEIDY